MTGVQSTVEETLRRGENNKINHEKRKKHERKAKTPLTADGCGGTPRKAPFIVDGQDEQDEKQNLSFHSQQLQYNNED